VDGQRVKHFGKRHGQCEVADRPEAKGDTIAFTVKREGQEITIPTGWSESPQASSWRRPALREVQIGPRLIPGVGICGSWQPCRQGGFSIPAI